MATFILVLFFGMFSLAIVPWLAQLNQFTHYNKLHKTDLMAGDEGE
jgi:hypothetical protein